MSERRRPGAILPTDQVWQATAPDERTVVERLHAGRDRWLAERAAARVRPLPPGRVRSARARAVHQAARAHGSTNARLTALLSTNACLLNDPKILRVDVNGVNGWMPDMRTQAEIRKIVSASEDVIAVRKRDVDTARRHLRAALDALHEVEADRRVLIARMVLAEGIPATAMARTLGLTRQTVHEIILKSGLRDQLRTRGKRGQPKKSTQIHRKARRRAAARSIERLERLGIG